MERLAMQYVIMDLEWNGAFCKELGGYFNEIIDLGAVRLDEQLQVTGQFSRLIRPKVSTKLTEIVRSLTSLSNEDLDNGKSFEEVAAEFTAWLSGDDVVLMTWSTSDLLVLLENFRFFHKQEFIPFLKKYADLQAFSQSAFGMAGGNHLGLQNAASMLEIPTDGEELHRALGDSLLSARVFQKQFDADAFAPFVSDASCQEFYDRLTFKTVIISDYHHPQLDRNDFLFSCPDCGGKLKRTTPYLFRRRRFCAQHTCARCNKTFDAWVQVKLKYEGPTVKRGIREHVEKPTEESHSESSVSSSVPTNP
ncbi:MAG: exonuclease domain-containing protein [Clostridiales bacterium]|nr:exonuclease domain-containing protein [Clostridiales bacterium]